MVAWFEERLSEASHLAKAGRMDEARARVKMALGHVHRDDPLAAKAQSVFNPTSRGSSA